MYTFPVKILSFNTQKGYHENLGSFLKETLAVDAYDFILLQEATDSVLAELSSESHSLLRISGSQLAIWYRNSYSLKDSLLEIFERKHPGVYPHPAAYGLLLGTFFIGSRETHIGSMHLHSGIRPAARLEQLGITKKKLLEIHKPGVTMICGGDFNLGVPGELKRTGKLLHPELSLVTSTLGGTLDSRYTEAYPSITNTVARILGRWGLGLTFATDHFFVDRRTGIESTIITRILPDRASDHLPIVLEVI